MLCLDISNQMKHFNIPELKYFNSVQHTQAKCFVWLDLSLVCVPPDLSQSLVGAVVLVPHASISLCGGVPRLNNKVHPMVHVGNMTPIMHHNGSTRGKTPVHHVICSAARKPDP